MVWYPISLNATVNIKPKKINFEVNEGFNADDMNEAPNSFGAKKQENTK